MRTQLRYATSVLVALLALCFGQLVGFAAPAHASDAAAAVGFDAPSTPRAGLGGTVPLQAWVRDTSFGCLSVADCDTPTGTVDFYLEGDGQHQELAHLQLKPVGGIHALAQTGVIYSTVNLPAGDSYYLTAQYQGDSTFGSHHETIAFQVSKGSLKASLKQTSSSSAKGASVRFTDFFATKAHEPTPTGTVRFYDNGHLMATAGFDPPNPYLPPRAGVDTTALSPGVHTITATYSGDSNYNPVTAPAVKHTVHYAIPSLDPCLLTKCSTKKPGVTSPPTGSNPSCTSSGSQGHAAGDCGVGSAPPSSGPISAAGGTAAGGAVGGGAPGGGAGGSTPGDGAAGSGNGDATGPAAAAGSDGSDSGTAVLAAGNEAAGSAAAGPLDPQASSGSHSTLWLAIGIVILLAIVATLILIARRRHLPR